MNESRSLITNFTWSSERLQSAFSTRILNIITLSKGGLPPLVPSDRFKAFDSGLPKTSHGTTSLSFTNGSPASLNNA